MIKHRHEHQLYKHLILHLHAFVINFAGISTIFDSVTLTYAHIVFSKLSSFLFILLFFIKYLTAMLILTDTYIISDTYTYSYTYTCSYSYTYTYICSFSFY
jgi:hypothetical protein